MKFKAFLLFIVLSTGIINIFASDDWTRFRGPNGNGISSSTNLPVEFGPDKNVVWKTSLPPGHSSPVLTRSRIFLTAFENEKLYVIGLDRKTGKLLWKNEVPRTQKRHITQAEQPRFAKPRNRRQQRLRLLSGIRSHFIHLRRQRALAHADKRTAPNPVWFGSLSDARR
ncbi:MAG: hypothetical protein IPG76_15100 [Acidobacteria bacterium]|nr:hypothetical protein [Acidobacteriota bacterium]